MAAATAGAVALATHVVPPLITLMGEIVQHVTLWLSYVTMPF